MVVTGVVVIEDEVVVKIRRICTLMIQKKNEMAHIRYKLHFILPKSIHRCVAISPQMKMSESAIFPHYESVPSEQSSEDAFNFPGTFELGKWCGRLTTG